MGKKMKVIVGDLRNYQLVVWIFGLMVLLFSIKFLTGLIGLSSFFVSLIFVLIFWSLIYRSVKNLNNSFWPFGLFYLLFLGGEFTVDIIQKNMTIQLALIYIVSFLLFFTILNNLFTPIYYPFIRWWRPKTSSLPVTAMRRNRETVNGRLVDIRRNSAALIVFDSLVVGEKIYIEKYPSYMSEGIWGSVVTKRDYSFGRGYCLGIKFSFENGNSQEIYQDLKRTWSGKV